MIPQVTIPVSNVAQLMTLGFTHLEVWKSSDLGNSYQPLMQPVALPPVAKSLPASTTWQLGGGSIVIDFDGTPVTFSFPMPLMFWRPDQVVQRLNQVRPGCAVQDGNSVGVVGASSGRGHFIKIVSAPPSMFPPGTVKYGTDAFIPLSQLQLLYVYTDLGDYSKDDRYRWRFSANGFAPISEMNLYRKAAPAPPDLSKVSIGYAHFMDVGGSPLAARLIVADETPRVVGGSMVLAKEPLVVEADEMGFAQVRLVRGSTVKVAIEGSSFVRSIVVPDQVSFDILAAMGTAPDELTPVATTPLLTRRSI